MIEMPKTKKEFEMLTTMLIMSQLSSKDGVAFPSNVAQDRAQELADALDKRGFFSEAGTADRYRAPQPRRQNVSNMQQDMLVVDER